MNSWLRFNEKSLPDKEALYSNLHMEDLTDVKKECLKSLIIQT